MKKETLVSLIKECIQEILNENNLAAKTFSYNRHNLLKELEESSKCKCGSGLDSDWKLDSRGIPLAKVCPECEVNTLKGFRRDVLLDPNYKKNKSIDQDIDESTMSYSQLVQRFAAESKKKYKNADINKVYLYCIKNPNATILHLEKDPVLNDPTEFNDDTRYAIYYVFGKLGREKMHHIV
jgi:hypothetical protein